mgnify:CR=1 FL=1
MVDKDCIFCKIIAGEIPSTKIYEDDDVIAFEDIAPVVKVHVLVIPKKEIKNLILIFFNLFPRDKKHLKTGGIFL